MIRDGKIILILDGLDELVRNQGEQCARQLRVQLNHLAEKRSPKIVIACRNHILKWLLERSVLETVRGDRRIELRSLDTARISRRLSESGCRSDILKNQVLLKMISKVPLFYDVLLKSLEAGPAPAVGPIHSAADFWRTWIEVAAARSGLGLNVDELRLKLGRVATKMLEKRDDFLSERELQAADGELYNFVDRLTATECRIFTKEANDRWRFVHQAMREYALAWNIDFGLNCPKRPSAIKATPSFDYESAETYLYLENLRSGGGLDSAIESLGPRLEAVEGDDAEWNNFARNYFEAVGMLGVRGNALRSVVEQALIVLDRTTIERRVSFRTRFNAARCLTRLHFSSPAVYCRYVTQPERETKLPGILVYGYAVRGFHQRSHTTGNRPPELLLSDEYPDRTDPLRHVKPALERRVSEALMEVICKLSEVEELHPDGVFLQVNCSHALIRWLAAGGAEQAKDFVLSEHLSREVRGNLLLALAIRGNLPQGFEVEIETGDRTRYWIKDLSALFK
jgi:hypothetical protein